jgi:hypothetical protein
MKKNKFSILGMLAMALALGFSFVGCATGSGSGSGNGDDYTIYYQTYWNDEDSELNITFWGTKNSKELLTDAQKAAVDALVPSDMTIQNIGGGNLSPRGNMLYQNTRTDLYGKKLLTTGSKSGTNNKITIATKNGFTFAEYSNDNTF